MRRLTVIRTKEIFDIIVDYPDSANALKDLKVLTTCFSSCSLTDIGLRNVSLVWTSGHTSFRRSEKRTCHHFAAIVCTDTRFQQ